MAEELTTKEAEHQYNVSRGHLTHLAEQGVIQARRIGPVWVLQRESLEHWLANRPKRGGYRGRKAHRQQQAEANQQPAAPPVGVSAAKATPRALAKPVTRVSHASEQLAEMQEAKPAAPAPTETAIDREGAHITIDPLLPDLQRWMHAEAIKGDVTAWCDIRPYPDARWPGSWVVDYYYDRKDRNKKGAIGRNQEERAQALMFLLRDQLTQALQAAGWQTLTKTPSGQTLWHYRPGQQKEAQP